MGAEAAFSYMIGRNVALRNIQQATLCSPQRLHETKPSSVCMRGLPAIACMHERWIDNSLARNYN
jgi:hypothetical protein